MSQEAETKFVELGEICEFNLGASISVREQFDTNIEGKCWPLMRVGNMQQDRLGFKILKWVNPEKIKKIENFVTHSEDILIATRGSTAGRVYCNQLKKEKILFSNNIVQLKTNCNWIQQKYLFYCLLNRQKILNLLIKVAAIPMLDIKEVKKLKVPAPDLNSQNKIANWLDKFRELTDQSTGKLSREILLLKHQSKYYSNRLINN